MTIASLARQFEHRIDIEVLIHRTDDFIVSLENGEGRILKMVGINLPVGLNRFWLDHLEWLSSGSYILHISNTRGNSLYTTELIKQ